MRRFRGLVALCLSTVLACGTSGDQPAGVDATAGANASGGLVGTPTTPFERAALELGVAATSLDDAGRPRMLRAVTAMAAPVSASVVEAARFHVATLAPAWGADARTPADL